jgi:hypothetical protein
MYQYREETAENSKRQRRIEGVNRTTQLNSRSSPGMNDKPEKGSGPHQACFRQEL